MTTCTQITDFFNHIYHGKPCRLVSLHCNPGDCYYSWQRLIGWQKRDQRLADFMIFLEITDIDADFFVWSDQLVSFLDTLRNRVLFYVLYSRCWYGDRRFFCSDFPLWLPPDLLTIFMTWSRFHSQDQKVTTLVETWHRQPCVSKHLFFKDSHFGALTEYQLVQHLFSNLKESDRL